MFSRILVPLDGSKVAGEVLPRVALLARIFNSEIFLLGMWQPEKNDGESFEIYLRKEARLLRRELRGWAKEVNLVIREGNAAERILEYTLEQEVDLIVMPSRAGAGQWLPGNTAERLLHGGKAVLVVQVEENAPPAADIFARVLVPLDGSEAATRVINPLASIGRAVQSDITLLMVVEKEHHVRTIGGLDYVPYLDDDLAARKTAAAGYLGELSGRLENSFASVKTKVLSGSPAEEILKLASGMDATLIAMASHVHSPLESWFYGSVTHKIIQAAGSSFLLVPVNRAI